MLYQLSYRSRGPIELFVLVAFSRIGRVAPHGSFEVVLFKISQTGGVSPGSLVFRLFSLTSSALEQAAAAPPYFLSYLKPLSSYCQTGGQD